TNRKPEHSQSSTFVFPLTKDDDHLNGTISGNQSEANSVENTPRTNRLLSDISWMSSPKDIGSQRSWSVRSEGRAEEIEKLVQNSGGFKEKLKEFQENLARQAEKAQSNVKELKKKRGYRSVKLDPQIKLNAIENFNKRIEKHKHKMSQGVMYVLAMEDKKHNGSSSAIDPESQSQSNVSDN
ncbi:hypothetical protein RFI_17125, partial [Reticulomyxa filosa]